MSTRSCKSVIAATAVVYGVSALSLIPTAHAHGVNFILRTGADFGGDDLIEVAFTDGSTEDIQAGELIHLAAGLDFPTSPANEALRTEVSIGWEFDRADAVNGEVEWERYPLELLQFYSLGYWRFGGGATYHINPTLDGEGFAGSVDLEFDDALGFVVQADVAVGPYIDLGARFTSIEYSAGGVDVDGNSFGVIASLRF
ncbi:MAG: hypothetical protein ACR2RB_06950 [Gammaproteobacteria bacterium]